MGHLDPIAYTFDADYHCEGCTVVLFGRGACFGEIDTAHVYPHSEQCPQYDPTDKEFEL